MANPSKPWADDIQDRDLDDDAIEELWGFTSPSDYYFTICPTDDGPCAIICPASYFDEQHCLYDQHLLIEQLLPDDFEQIMEATFLFDRTDSSARKELLKRGFKENVGFTAFIADTRNP
jgi:hypothetical protein